MGSFISKTIEAMSKLIKSWVTIAALALLPLAAYCQVRPGNLRCEYKIDPAGVQTSRPHLKWEITSPEKNVLQTAYRVIVSESPSRLQSGTGEVWDSRKVLSGGSIQISYAGSALQSTHTYYWKVMVWDNRGDSAWSAPASWQMGLLTPADWKGATWIAYNKMTDSARILPGHGHDIQPALTDTLPLLRKEFRIDKQVKKATVFISGVGQFELHVNGHKVGDHFLDPSWTQYEKEAAYVTFDVTSQLTQGDNVIGAMLGNGFYFIPGDPTRYKKLMVQYGYPAMICRLKITYNDGTSENIISNGNWKAAPGPILFSSEYGGEDYDATREIRGWDSPGLNTSGWKNAVVTQGPSHLEGMIEDPVRIMDRFSAKKIYQVPSGAWVYDLGQNAAGIPAITVRGKKGDTIRITPAEIVEGNGEISQKGSGGPSYFTYILKGAGDETWQPRFSYYGFRYLQVEGGVPAGKPNPSHLPVIEQAQGLHIRNSAETVGTFWCSDTLFNRIFTLIDWSIKSNMTSLFTDCPHREKLGWLEEAHLMGSSIHYNYDIANLNRRTIFNMEDAQTSDGLVPDIAPEYVWFNGGFRDSPEWGSSSVLVPWYTYQWYGDLRVLRQSYSMMKRYIDYLGSKAQDHILSYGLGDWFDIGPRRPGVSQLTPLGLTATAMYYYDLTTFAKTAGLLGNRADSISYSRLASEVRNAFNRKYYNPATHEYATGSQTSNAMAVYMDLVDPKNRRAVVDNIVKDIRAKGNSLSSGDVGYRYLLQVLESAGRSDVIYEMNNREDVPGYGYQLAHGATALTESWQAFPSVSNDHLMLGHLMEWFYSGLAGIKQTDQSVGYHHIEIAPQPVGSIHSCKASFMSPYGKISSSWEKSRNTFTLRVHIPANTTASIVLPASHDQTVLEDGKTVPAARVSKRGEGKASIQIGSGDYTFLVK